MATLHLWITDPWHTLDHPWDTSLRLMQESLAQGLRPYWCDVKSIQLDGKKISLRAKPVISVESKLNQKAFQWGEESVMEPWQFSFLHYRPDPPVDLTYLHPLQIIALGLKQAKKTQVINPLPILLGHNEKMEAKALPELMPISLVSSTWESIQNFGRKRGRTVLKPLHTAQSKGIELLDWRTPDGIFYARQKVSEATNGFQTPVLLQEYLAGISEGETRLWFAGGKFLASVKKLPLTGDFRVNIDRGSQLQEAKLTRKEKAIAAKISRHLTNFHIRLAAVDLIENRITDFNFTSPGLIPKMEELLRANLAREIVKALRS